MTKQQRDWWATARIGKELDHRRKLTDEDKEDIRRLYKRSLGGGALLTDCILSVRESKGKKYYIN